MIRKQVLAFGKSEKSEFIYIGSFGLSGVTRIWGPNIDRSRWYRVWSHVCNYSNFSGVRIFRNFTIHQFYWFQAIFHSSVFRNWCQRFKSDADLCNYVILHFRRKQDSLAPHNLFSLLGERLMLNDQHITMATYNVLFEVFTKNVYQLINQSVLCLTWFSTWHWKFAPTIINAHTK